jgi:hypothetical protein
MTQRWWAIVGHAGAWRPPERQVGGVCPREMAAQILASERSRPGGTIAIDGALILTALRSSSPAFSFRYSF